MSKTLLIELTGDQTEQVQGLIASMEEGGVCFAQVYADGMRVRTFDRATALRVQEAIGLTAGDPGRHNSAVDAHAAAQVLAN